MFNDIGTWAEEITIPANCCAKIPSNIDINEAGSIALPLLTAYDSLTQLNAKKGEKILIHGVGGGVGFQILQLAKQMRLFVIGTGSQSDKAVLDKAGLDQFIDYKTQDFSQVLKVKEVDYVIDLLGADILKKSIALKPKKVISLKAFVDTAKLDKAGVNLPSIMKWLIKMTMRKFVKLAKKNNVQLIGQVTEANGKIQKAVDLISVNYISRNYKRLSLTDISTSGLTKNDVGKVIVF